MLMRLRRAVLLSLLCLVSFASSASALDVSDIDSINLGGTCVAKGMRLQDVVAQFDKNPGWEFRWDEKMVMKDGMVAGLVPRNRAETPFVLQFTFLSKKPMGEGVLVRIGWGGKQSDPEAAGLAKRIGCRR